MIILRIMASSLGRRCKAKVKPSVAPMPEATSQAELNAMLVAEAAADLAKQTADIAAASYGLAREMEIANEPGPWEPWDEMLVVPCTDCLVPHHGSHDCELNDLALAEMSKLQVYSDAGLPQLPEFHRLRCHIYEKMADVHDMTKSKQVTAEQLLALRAEVKLITARCDFILFDVPLAFT